MNRLSQLPTLKIKPTEQIGFIYKGKKLYGVKGDTIASALFANGVRIFGRSLKYHRPRGLYSLDGECSNTCMEVDGVHIVINHLEGVGCLISLFNFRRPVRK